MERTLTQDPNWEYPKRRDTRSRDYVIAGNTFAGNPTALKITETQNVRVLTNGFEKVGTVAVLTGDTRNFGVGDEVSVPDPAAIDAGDHAAETAAGRRSTPRSPIAERRGREAIIVDEWGPYDWKSPKLWPDGRSDATPLKLRVLGPAGEWKIASVRGATVEPAEGQVPGGDHRHAHRAEARRAGRYRRAVDVSRRGDRRPARRNGRGRRALHLRLCEIARARRLADPLFHVRRGVAARQEPGRVRAHPRRRAGEDRSARQARLHVGRSDRGRSSRAIAWRSSPKPRSICPPGAYTVRTISDDGVRVWMDDERIIDHWTPHESAIDTVPVTGGKRRFKVEYYEIGGFAELRFEILRR